MTAREDLGRLVRETWIAWAREQPDPKPSWLVPFDDLDEGQREVDMRIGEAVAAAERERLRRMPDEAWEHLTNIVTWAALWDVERNDRKNQAVYDQVLPYFGYPP